MARSIENDGLQLEDDLVHPRREWRIRRVGWIVMLALVLAAARASHGLAAMDEVEHAVIEATGEITVIPRERSARHGAV